MGKKFHYEFGVTIMLLLLRFYVSARNRTDGRTTKYRRRSHCRRPWAGGERNTIHTITQYYPTFCGLTRAGGCVTSTSHRTAAAAWLAVRRRLFERRVHTTADASIVNAFIYRKLGGKCWPAEVQHKSCKLLQVENSNFQLLCRYRDYNKKKKKILSPTSKFGEGWAFRCSFVLGT